MLIPILRKRKDILTIGNVESKKQENAWRQVLELPRNLGNAKSDKFKVIAKHHGIKEYQLNSDQFRSMLSGNKLKEATFTDQMINFKNIYWSPLNAPYILS